MGQSNLKTIDLVYFKAGGGHQAAAAALESVIREQERPWRVRLIDLFEVLDPQQLFKRTTRLNPEDFYNKRLARGWTLGLAQELKVLQAFIRLGHNKISRRLQRHWRRTRPDMVVSLVPNFNRAMYEAVVTALPGAPYVTLLTDFADHPPHFWIEPNQVQHFVCGTQKAAAQARAVGSTRATIHSTSGMIIRPDFYRETRVDRVAELRKLGLDPNRTTGLVMFGGHGSRVMRGITAELADTQLILMCGHNAALASCLRNAASSSPSAAPRHVVDFTKDVRYYTALSDFFIGKPGPGSLSEAIQQGLPVIVARNAATMPQERYNTDWILEQGAGLVIKSFSGIGTAVAEMTSRLDEFRRNIYGIRNRAVFEIPDILKAILDSDLPVRSASSARYPKHAESLARI